LIIEESEAGGTNVELPTLRSAERAHVDELVVMVLVGLSLIALRSHRN
jgi:hypothetical protein